MDILIRKKMQIAYCGRAKLVFYSLFFYNQQRFFDYLLDLLNNLVKLFPKK